MEQNVPQMPEDHHPPVQKKMLEDGQLAKAIYLRNMSGMKEILNMGEFRIGDRKSKEYKFFKKVVMDEFYNAMSDLFSALEEKGVLAKCPCGTSIRQGYKPCALCNGAGYCSTEEFRDWLLDVPEDDSILDVES
jgi:hypothetical protein